MRLDIVKGPGVISGGVVYFLVYEVQEVATGASTTTHSLSAMIAKQRKCRSGATPKLCDWLLYRLSIALHSSCHMSIKCLAELICSRHVTKHHTTSLAMLDTPWLHHDADSRTGFQLNAH